MPTSSNDSEHDVVLFHPESIDEALQWVFSAKSYKLNMALNRAPLKVSVSSITAFLVFESRRKSSYTLEFAEDGMISSVYFREKPSLLTIEPTKTSQCGLFLKEAKYYIKNIHRLGATTTYVLIMTSFVLILQALKVWLFRNIDEHHWLSWGSCDLSCAKHATSVHFSIFNALFLILLPSAWGLAFYAINKKMPRTYSHFFSLRFECALLFIVGMAIAFSAAKMDIWSKYEKFAMKHWSGTLSIRHPASK